MNKAINSYLKMSKSFCILCIFKTILTKISSLVVKVMLGWHHLVEMRGTWYKLCGIHTSCGRTRIPTLQTLRTWFLSHFLLAYIAILRQFCSVNWMSLVINSVKWFPLWDVVILFLPWFIYKYTRIQKFILYTLYSELIIQFLLSEHSIIILHISTALEVKVEKKGAPTWLICRLPQSVESPDDI